MTVPISNFQRFLEGLPEDERAEMDEVIKRAMQIEVGIDGLTPEPTQMEMSA